MAEKLFIVHGYSDGSTSFKGLAKYFVDQGLYARKDVYLVNYASMDDQATFRDFADKLNDKFNEISPDGSPVDVACHSTGALVVRTWLAFHHEWNMQAWGMQQDCPVDHLLMFAPANFGSDLARMGQSFLGKTRSTFFNNNSRKKDGLESGKIVLQGLEPASPFQWELSHYDLHGEGAYFNPANEARHRCYPFVFASGYSYTGVQARLLKKRRKPGTDGTVRISGTSLNTRKCSLSFVNGARLKWEKVLPKFSDIPFAVFDNFNHGSIIDPEQPNFKGFDRPGGLSKQALKITSLEAYEEFARKCRDVSEANYKKMDKQYKDRYQQFFIKVRDDIDTPVEDFFIDFYVLPKGKTKYEDFHKKLTQKFDEEFESTFYTHSADSSCRVMLLNCSKLDAFIRELVAAKARLVFEITAHSPRYDITFLPVKYTVLDGANPDQQKGPLFIYPNTTTLVDIMINRQEGDDCLDVIEYRN